MPNALSGRLFLWAARRPPVIAGRLRARGRPPVRRAQGRGAGKGQPHRRHLPARRSDVVLQADGAGVGRRGPGGGGQRFPELGPLHRQGRQADRMEAARRLAARSRTPRRPPGHYATLRIEAKNRPSVDLIVTKFPGDVGGVLANVNRWRKQIGLQPIGDDELDKATRKEKLNGGRRDLREDDRSRGQGRLRGAVHEPARRRRRTRLPSTTPSRTAGRRSPTPADRSRGPPSSRRRTATRRPRSR